MFLSFCSPPTTTSPDVDSFPPLLSTVNSHAERLGDKPENERSRKRRKRRKQRKRSGSVSSSSSECSEKERTSGNSTGFSIKGKTAASLLTTDKVIVSKVDSDAGKVHVNVLCSSPKEQKDSNNSTDKKTTSQRKSTSSCDGETIGDTKSSSSTDGTSNSPVQSDTDVKITVSANTAEQLISSDKINESLKLENESPSTVDEGKHSSSAAHEERNKKELPKPSSWADLFKNSAKASPGVVIKVTNPVIRTETNSTSAGTKTEEPVQTTVGVEEDKYAKNFAGTVNILNIAKAFDFCGCFIS